MGLRTIEAMNLVYQNTAPEVHLADLMVNRLETGVPGRAASRMVGSRFPKAIDGPMRRHDRMNQIK